MKFILALLLALCLVIGAFCENDTTNPISSTTVASTTTSKKSVKVDDACDLPKAVGRCRAKKTRYFYNSDSEKCEKFQYGGCDGNANQFFTKEACKKACM